MKKFLSFMAITLMITFIFSLFSAQAVSAQPMQNGKITVTGCGQVTLAPDTATICVGVKTTADTLEKANTENKEKISKLYETLKANDIAENNIQTKNFYACEEYSYKETEPKLLGYTVSNQVVVKTTNLNNLTALVSSLTADGANNFYGVNFSSSKENETYKTALSNALGDAKEKAKILTNSENVTVVEVVEESVFAHRNFACASKAEMMPDNAFFGGELIVNARVTVVFNTQNEIAIQDNEKAETMPKENKEKKHKQTTKKKRLNKKLMFQSQQPLPCKTDKQLKKIQHQYQICPKSKNQPPLKLSNKIDNKKPCN